MIGERRGYENRRIQSYQKNAAFFSTGWWEVDRNYFVKNLDTQGKK